MCQFYFCVKLKLIRVETKIKHEKDKFDNSMCINEFDSYRSESRIWKY